MTWRAQVHAAAGLERQRSFFVVERLQKVELLSHDGH